MKRIAAICCFLLISISIKAIMLDDYFSPPEHSGQTVLVSCRFMVPDNSSEWVKILISGFAYAASSSDSEEIIAVAIKEQDYLTHIYSVKKSDFVNFLNDRISLNEFVRKIRMSKGR